MRIVQDYAGVAAVAPMVVHPVLDSFVLYCEHYMDDNLARKHHHLLRARCIRTGYLPELATNLEHLQYSEFVPDSPVALQLHRNWMEAHLWALSPDLFCPTRNRDTAAGVSLPPRLKSFAGWIVIPFQILAGSCIAPLPMHPGRVIDTSPLSLIPKGSAEGESRFAGVWGVPRNSIPSPPQAARI